MSGDIDPAPAPKPTFADAMASLVPAFKEVAAYFGRIEQPPLLPWYQRWPRAAAAFAHRWMFFFAVTVWAAAGLLACADFAVALVRR